MDTQILLWIIQSPKKLKETTRKLIDQNSGQLYVSSIAMFEILHKVKIGKLQFDLSFDELNFFDWLDLTRQHIAFTSELPLIHRDPFDRLLIAQSMIERIPLITADSLIQKYEFEHFKA